MRKVCVVITALKRCARRFFSIVQVDYCGHCDAMDCGEGKLLPPVVAGRCSCCASEVISREEYERRYA